jgi:tetraacyldisaccharide 4'-kinase
MLKQLRKLLWPFSVLYNTVTHWRNRAFDKGYKPAAQYPLPVICIGNLSTGGTGKSPMTEYLLQLLNARNTAVVSRGYGRTTKGLLEVSLNSDSKEVGDEPLQLKLGFPKSIVVVSEKRVQGIAYILEQYPETEIVLLDDAYQHRHVQAGFNILLSNYHAPFYTDLVLPAGNLRESRAGASRADLIVVTKCPATLTAEGATDIKNKMNAYSHAPVFFSTIAYAQPFNSWGTIPESVREVQLLTGIAYPAPLVAHVRENFALTQHLEFKDHHRFTTAELHEIEASLTKQNTVMLTTQKDFMRLKEHLSEAALKQLFVVPIKTKLLFEGKEDFNNLIINYINS